MSGGLAARSEQGRPGKPGRPAFHGRLFIKDAESTNERCSYELATLH